MRESKLLPWLSRRAGLPLAAGHRLWQETVREAGTGFHGPRPGPAYYRYLVSALRKRLAQAAPRATPRPVSAYPFPPAFLILLGFHMRILGQFWSAWARALQAGSALRPRRLNCKNQNL